MKEGWTYKKLGEVCEVLDYRRKPITKGKRISGNIPYYGATGCLDYVKDYIFNEKLLLLGEDGAKWGAGDNSAYIVNGKSWINNHAHVLKPKRDITNDEYLVYFLNYEDLQPFITGVTVPKLNQEKMRSILIPLPHLSEQQRIVKQLDEAFAEIDTIKAAAEKQLSEAKALFQKALSQAMTPKEGWEEKTLGEVTIFSQGIQVDVNLQTELYSPDKVRFLRIIDVTQGNMPPRYIDDPGEKYHLKANEIAMVRYGTTVGYVCYGYEGVIANNLFKITIKDKSKLQSNYLQYFLKSNLVQSHIRNGVGGAALPAIKFGDIKNVQLCLPPLSDQQRIVEELDELAENVKEIEKLNDKLTAECDAMKQALLRQVFE